MKAIFPFSGGLVIGYVFAFLILAAAPWFAFPSTGPWPLAIPVCSALIAVYALLMLLLIGCFSSQTRLQSPMVVSGMIGIAIPVLGVGMFVVGAVVTMVSTPSRWVVEDFGVWLIATLTIVAPFALVQWRKHQLSPEAERQRIRSMLKKVAVAVILLVMMLGVGRWAAEMKFENECRKLAAWVKSDHQAPGIYAAVALPLSQYSLADDHAVDAVVLPDGRVILLLKTSLGWHYNWSGIIYSSGPITTKEIGTDAYGRPRIGFDGLPEHFVQRQIDSRHFVVAFDLG